MYYIELSMSRDNVVLGRYAVVVDRHTIPIVRDAILLQSKKQKINWLNRRIQLPWVFCGRRGDSRADAGGLKIAVS